MAVLCDVRIKKKKIKQIDPIPSTIITNLIKTETYNTHNMHVQFVITIKLLLVLLIVNAVLAVGPIYVTIFRLNLLRNTLHGALFRSFVL